VEDRTAKLRFRPIWEAVPIYVQYHGHNSDTEDT